MPVDDQINYYQDKIYHHLYPGSSYKSWSELNNFFLAGFNKIVMKCQCYAEKNKRN